MNHILKKDFIPENDHKIISQQFRRIISFGRRASSAERKSFRVLNNSVHRKTSSNSKKILFPNNIRLSENNNFSKLAKNMKNNRTTERLNDIKIIKENNITDINMIFKSREKARTFNRQSNTSQMKSSSGINSINKIKSNQISFNNIIKIKNGKYKNNREMHKKKFVIENPTLSINDINNKTTTAKNKILIRNNSGFNMSIHNNNSSSKRNTDVSQGKFLKSDILMNKDIKNARKIKLKNKVKNKSKDIIINNNKLYYTMNTKIKKIKHSSNIQDLKQKIIMSNSLRNIEIDDKNNTELNSLIKKRKNIDINTEFQMTPIIHMYSMDKNSLHTNNKLNDNTTNNFINFNNTTTSKVKLKIFEINKEKEEIHFAENNPINKTKSKAKVKNQEIRKEPTDNEKRKKIENDNIINSSKFKKVKSIQKNEKNDVCRKNTYNNESSFCTININASNLDEKNNNELKNNMVNYCFVSSALNKDKMDFNTQVNNTINNKEEKKINNFYLFKMNSNIKKNKLLQNSVFDFITDSQNFNSNNLNKDKNENTIKNNIITNQKKEEKIKTQNEPNKINNINIQQNMNNKDNNDEVIENFKKDIEIQNNVEEIKEKDTFLDKSTSRVIQMHQEDFIEKDDEVINLLNPELQKENINNNNINNNLNPNEEESEIIIQNSEFSIINKNNYILNNQNIYQNININIFQNNSKNIPNNNIKTKPNLNNNNNHQNANINIDNTTMKDISISSNCGIRASKSLTQAGKERTGHRKKNQDNFIIEKNINNIPEFNIFAVLDGHGDNGHIVSQLASKYLIKKFTSITQDFNDVESVYNFLKKSDYQKIINIFLETDTEIITQTKFDVSLSGSTCVFVLQLGEHIICANIGDSRAILIYEENGKNNIFELSHDSKPDVPEEKRRIELLGGIVDQTKDENGERTGPFRVYMKNGEQPGLAMSRSFGDKKAKCCGVIPFPDIIENNLKLNIKYMVICSDGVWEFLSNEEVMEIGDKYFYQNDINEFCNQLLKRSTEIWENEENYMDDITIVVVFF